MQLILFCSNTKTHLISVTKRGHGFRFIDNKGNVIIDESYYRGNYKSFSEGLLAVKQNRPHKFSKKPKKQAYVYIDKSASLVIDGQFENAESFREGLAHVTIAYKYGYINKQGKIIIPAIYDEVSEFKMGMAWVRNSDKYGLINKKGKIVLPLKYNRIYSFSNGLAAIQEDDNCFYLNSKAKFILQGIYSHCRTFINKRAVVKFKNGKWKIINTKGIVLKDLENGNRWLKKIGKKDRRVTSVQWKTKNIKYTSYLNFHDGLAKMKKYYGNYYGYIDKNRKIIIDEIYSKVGNFRRVLQVLVLEVIRLI